MTGDHNSNSRRCDLSVDGWRILRRRGGAVGAVRRAVGRVVAGALLSLQGRHALSSEWEGGDDSSRMQHMRSRMSCGLLRLVTTLA